METPLKLLQGLIIPKSMNRAREAWVFLLLILPPVGLAIAYEAGEVGIIVAAVLGLTLAVLLRTSLVKLSKSQLERYYNPLVQSLADADGLAAHCRTQIDARLKEERIRLTKERDEGLKRAEETYFKAIAAGEAHRDERLRKINEVYAQQIVDVQTTQQRDLRTALDTHDRKLAELRAQVETAFPKLEGKYKTMKSRSRIVTKPHGKEWRDNGARD